MLNQEFGGWGLGIPAPENAITFFPVRFSVGCRRAVHETPTMWRSLSQWNSTSSVTMPPQERQSISNVWALQSPDDIYGTLKGSSRHFWPHDLILVSPVICSHKLWPRSCKGIMICTSRKLENSFLHCQSFNLAFIFLHITKEKKKTSSQQGTLELKLCSVLKY